MSNGTPNPPVAPKSALDTLKEWKELILFVALTVSSAVTGVFGNEHPKLQRGSWILAVLFVGVGAYVVHRKQKRRREQERREKIWEESEAQRKAGSAFRSLAPYEERDELPGKDRKVEARAIATRIASDDFSFGVVCGDTGCGKTSMLRSEITRFLRESGFEVAYVRNPRRLESKTDEALPRAERLASELRSLARNYIKPTTGALILDQFEEWLIEYQEPELRLQIGRFIRKLAERSQRVRIVCAIRREFLIDLHDLSDELPQQLATTNLFHIKNFTVDQAKDVITECANADGLGPDQSFAETAAHDLAEGGQVRPPELQIVCTYLAVSGGLNTPKYRRAGGTAGILAHYIQDALEASKAPAISAGLLRALCDFPAGVKRKPKTLDELIADLDTDGSTSGSSVKNVTAELAHQLVLGRILTNEQRQNTNTYALMHDYLVDAINLATADISTQTEEANQLLRYYLAEKRRTIPFRKLRFIQRFAERRYLKEEAARRLVRLSIISPLVWSVGTALVAVALTAGLYLLVTTESQWESTMVGRHFPEGKSGSVDIVRLTNRKVATWDENAIRIWDSKNGKLVATVKGTLEFRFSPTNHYLLSGIENGLYGPYKDKPQLVGLETLEQTALPVRISSAKFSRSEEWLAFEHKEDIQPKEHNLLSATPTIISTYSVKTKRVIGTIRHVPSSLNFYISSYKLADAGDRLVVIESKGKTFLYDASSGHIISKLATAENSYADRDLVIALNDISSQICIASVYPGEIIVSLYDLRTGNLLCPERRLKTDLNTSSYSVSFSDDGSHVILQERTPELVEYLRVFILSTTDLDPLRNLPDRVHFVGRSDIHGETLWLRDIMWTSTLGSVASHDPREMMVWSANQSANIWDGSRSGPTIIDGLNIDSTDRLLLNKSRNRLIIWRTESNMVQLWDLARKQMIGLPSRFSPLKGVGFSQEDKSVLIEEEGGRLTIFDAEDGRTVIQGVSQGASPLLEVFYDPSCRQILLWNESGQVIRLTEGRKYFGRFVPSRRCE